MSALNPAAHLLLPHRLSKAFAGSTGLVDVGVIGDARDQAVRPHVDAGIADGDLAERDSAAELHHLFEVNLDLVVRAKPVLHESSDRGAAAEHSQPPSREI